VTVVATHQLVPHVQYPGGADDIQLAREWIYKNISSEKFGKGSVNKVILFGHSRSANFSVPRLGEDISWRGYGAKLIIKVEVRILLQIFTQPVGNLFS
jgi:hypothetical protein